MYSSNWLVRSMSNVIVRKLINCREQIGGAEHAEGSVLDRPTLS